MPVIRRERILPFSETWRRSWLKFFQSTSSTFCKEKVAEVDWKNFNQLRRHVSEKGKLRSRRITGTCRRHQRQVAVAVKRAREMALLPYVTD